MPPTFNFSVCQGVSAFSTFTSSLTTLSRQTMESRTISLYSTLTGSLTGFVSSEWVSNSTRDGSGRFGVFILQYRYSIERLDLLYDDWQLHPGCIPDGFLHNLHFHPSIVLDWKRPNSTAGRSNEQKKHWQ